MGTVALPFFTTQQNRYSVNLDEGRVMIELKCLFVLGRSECN